MIAWMAVTTLSACSASNTSHGPRTGSSVDTIRYGADASQFAELTRPSRSSKGVVVVIHGGFWKAEYDLSLGRPLAAALAERGWTAYNLEYRRVGNGGGWPQTLDDVAAGIDALAAIDGIDTSTVVTLGHSAGGHLAVWAAGRPMLRGTPWSAPVVPVTAAISQAGVLDLRAAVSDDLGGAAAASFLGQADDAARDAADPMAQIPLEVPVWCVHARDDDTVPISQSAAYVDAARAAGAVAELIEVEGDHFLVIDPSSQAWARTLRILDTL